MEFKSHSENHYINDNQLSIEDYQDILAKLQGQINVVAQQKTMMEQCMDKLYGALRSPQGIQDKLVVHLEEENTLLRKQLTEFQVAHMELLAHRRRRTLQKYRDTYEASQGSRKGGNTRCDCSNRDDCQEDIDELD